MGNPELRDATMRRIILLSSAFVRDSGICRLGWYLLSPPKIRGVMEFDEKAAVAQWQQHGASDSAQDCARKLNGWRVRAMDRFKLVGSIENKYLSESAIFFAHRQR
jgi:hypothetical protein